MSKFDWKTKESKYILKHKWLTLRHDICEMPDGRMVDPYFVLEFPNWASVVAVTNNDEIVLVKQYRHGLGKTFLELPSGFTDENEKPIDCARRELLEETGYTSDDFSLLGTLSANPANHNNLNYCYFASDAKKIKQPQLDKTEHIEVVLKPIDEIIEMIKNDEFVNAMYLSTLFMALRKLGKIDL